MGAALALRLASWGNIWLCNPWMPVVYLENRVPQRGLSTRFFMLSKKQQMRWSEAGAHNLLQVRTKVLNDQLRETFVR